MLEKPINKGNWNFKPDKKTNLFNVGHKRNKKFIKGKGIVPLTLNLYLKTVYYKRLKWAGKISFKQCIRLVSTYYKYKYEVVDYAVTHIQIR